MATLIFIGVVIGYVIRGQLPPFSNSVSLFPTEEPKQSITLSPTQSVTSIPLPPDVHIVKEITDGDTIMLDNGQKVRYIGIDTPEIHKVGNKPTCFGNRQKKKILNSLPVKQSY
jgi:endonuclease YncB( thermonuclease family)